MTIDEDTAAEFWSCVQAQDSSAVTEAGHIDSVSC